MLSTISSQKQTSQHIEAATASVTTDPVSHFHGP